ncbi:ATP-binding protein [Rhizobium rhizogenes]|uniref:sensor histidine kinase n=1 Tax=Rhizobium rhizogenes TaxID=359 RepID=UPI001F1731CF|nr:ATP-binding protein [Rhizobium rhizogenes]
MSRFLQVAAMLIAIAIFLLDTLTNYDIAIAVLYVGVVLLSLNFTSRTGLLLTGAACMGLTVLSYLISHGIDFTSEPLGRCCVSLAAIGITTFLALRVKATITVLGESEQRYRTIFLATGVAILEMDFTAIKMAIDRLKMDGFPSIAAAAKSEPDFVHKAVKLMTLTNANNTTLTMFNAKSIDAFKSALPALIGNEMESSLWSLLDAIWMGRQTYESEVTMNDMDGGRHTVLYNVAMPADRPALDLVLISIMDVTDRREAENGLHAAQAELAHVTRVATLGELTASIAHEVNQPLAAVVTNGEAGLRWLKRAEPDLGEVEASMRRMIADARRASDVIRHLRALSSKTGSQTVPVDLNNVIEETMALVQREMTNHRIRLRLELANDLPAVLGDPVQLQQVTINLVLNAIQAMSGRRLGKRELSVTSSGDHEVVRIRVNDTGPGFASEEAANLFNAFYTTKSNGMGMGLSICRSIVSAHGGRVSASSDPVHGTSFEFTVPVQERAA